MCVTVLALLVFRRVLTDLSGIRRAPISYQCAVCQSCIDSGWRFM